MTTNHFSDELSSIARSHKKAESEKQEMEAREEKRAQIFLDQWRDLCNEVILPVFNEVAEHPDYKEDPAMRVRVEDGTKEVVLWVKGEALSFEADPKRKVVIMRGIKERKGLSRNLSDEPQTHDRKNITEHFVRTRVKDFLYQTLS